MKQIKTNKFSKVNILVMGPPGSGKSFAATTVPGKILVLKTEPGIFTGFHDPEFQSRSTVLEIDTARDLEGLERGLVYYLDLLNKRNKKSEEWEEIPTTGWDLVVLDSVTWAQELLMKAAMEVNSSSDGLPTKRTFGVVGKSLFQIVQALLKSPFNTYLTVQTSLRAMDPGNDNSPMKYMPSLVGYMRDRIMYDVDLVCWAEGKYSRKEGRTTYTITDQPRSEVAVKTRYQTPIGEMEFDLGRVLELVRKGGKKNA